MKETFSRWFWSDLSEPNDSKYDIIVNSSSDNCDIKITLSLNKDEIENLAKSCIGILGSKKIIQMAIDSE